jgi:hypothetical protein
MKGIKMELDHNSLLLTNQKYIKMPLILSSLTAETIGEHRLFAAPFDTEILLNQHSRDFRKVKSA